MGLAVSKGNRDLQGFSNEAEKGPTGSFLLAVFVSGGDYCPKYGKLKRTLVKQLNKVR